MLKTDQKKVQSQKKIFALSFRYNDITFYKIRLIMSTEYILIIFIFANGRAVFLN